ncbi:hypothetical protein C2845_PM12G12430 [Panicum miliaceum]|uniref:Uncharacterized protein n=1 Tax=Panicum miliaceum TaxID=4540 RepID=A0A3L6QJ77_PANMI|nr:hypothetical protein C2845_PM12G12430 [Panicum miliaceum]
METWPELHKAVKEAVKSLSTGTGSTMVAADLSCSSGPNTLLVISEVMSTVRACVRDMPGAMEVQFFLNDLPGNDFNLVFRSLEKLHSSVAVEAALAAAAPCYVAGLPGSMYTRIFPCEIVHLFHSSHCLIWRSKVPEDLSNGTHVNAGNIYIGKTTAQVVVKLFREQFERDFELFLTLRYKELVSGGRMVLTFAGRKRGEIPMHGGVARVWELLAEALQHLVQKGPVETKKLSSFNMPYYAPSVDEISDFLSQTGMPMMTQMAMLFPILPAVSLIIAKIIRAGIEPLIVNHFGEDILDELFMAYTSILAKDLEKGKAMCPVIVVILKKSKH